MGRAWVSARLGSGWENVYVFAQCTPGCTLVEGVWSSVGVVLISARVQCKMLRSVHCPSRCILWSGDSPSAAVSPLVKPMRTSMISWERDVRVPSFVRRLVWVTSTVPSLGGGVGRVPKRGSVVGGVSIVVGVFVSWWCAPSTESCCF